MASMAYSTWNSLPSGEKVLTPRSYSLLMDYSRISHLDANILLKFIK